MLTTHGEPLIVLTAGCVQALHTKYVDTHTDYMKVETWDDILWPSISESNKSTACTATSSRTTRLSDAMTYLAFVAVDTLHDIGWDCDLVGEIALW